jgi:cysteine synthase
MPVYPDIISTVGRTPLIKLNRITNGAPATIALKGEFFNPLGSVKDRIGYAMIAAAEREGRLILIRFQVETKCARVPVWHGHAGLIHSSLSGRN